MVLNPSAKVIVHSHNDDLDTAKIVWLENTPVIDNSTIKEQMDKINIRLTNKSFTDKAPKDIVEQEKTNFDNLEKDAKKIELTLKSL